MNKEEVTNLQIRYTAILSVVEIAIGSFLHSFKIPLSGHILSLNQAFILTRSSLEIEQKNSPGIIGMSTALFKSLSPAGKKLTPMLAISAQAHLFSAGLYISGNNLFGRILGSVLLSLWAFLQPIGIYFLIFGKNIIDIVNYFLEKLQDIYPVTAQNILTVLSLLIAIKCIAAIAVTIYAHKINSKKFDKYLNWTNKLKTKNLDSRKKSSSPITGAIKDLLSPLYLVSIILSIIFFIFVDSKHSTSIWVILRPITIGYFLFLILRIFPIEILTSKITNPRYKKIIEGVLLKIKD